MKFHNRSHAGVLLAQKMSNFLFDKKNTLVLAIGRGGVPVAFEIAQKFHLPLDVILVKKIGSPLYPELAIGTISEGNEVFYNDVLLEELGLKINSIKPITEQVFYELKKMGKNLRQNHEPLVLTHKDIVLVDDGINTGSTIHSVLQVLNERKVNKIFIVVPVASAEALLVLEKKVDSIVVLKSPNPVYSIAEWYKDFKQVEVSDVVKILNNYYKNTSFSDDLEKEKTHYMEGHGN